MREYSAGSPLVFNHIPKCAGNSVRSALIQALRPEVSVYGFDQSLFGGYSDISTARTSVRSSIFLQPDQLPAGASFVTGHIGPGTTMARYPEADHITLLRAPQVRLISQWLHSRSVSDFDIRRWGKGAEAFRVARHSLNEYLRHGMIAPNVDNTITRFLIWPHPLISADEFISDEYDDELFGAAVERLDSFAHVDVVENPDFMLNLGAWLGCELPQDRLNERTSVPGYRRPDLIAELDTQTMDLLQYRSRIDIRVWAYVAERSSGLNGEMSSLDMIMQKSINRYVDMLQQASDSLSPRRVAGVIYGIGLKARSRIRSSP